MAVYSLIGSRQSRLLQPALRAYILALLSTTAPQILGLFFSAIRGGLRFREAYHRAWILILSQLGFEQLPSACAILIGGATALPSIFWKLLPKAQNTFTKRRTIIGSLNEDTAIKFVSAALAAFASFALLNRRNSRAADFSLSTGSLSSVVNDFPVTGVNSSHLGRRRSSVALAPQVRNVDQKTWQPACSAGQTLDLTCLATVHAVTVASSYAWQKRSSGLYSGSRISNLEKYIRFLIWPTTFALSSSVIMWSWVYSPDRLPKSYNSWIASAASVDRRLIEVLRQWRSGNCVYGKPSDMTPTLQGLCEELGYPLEWADPCKTIPLPCELYHSGTGPNCEVHAFHRFWKSWTFAMRMYLPLNLLILIRREASKHSLHNAFVGATQSSAFLATFIALFYYGVCCARTRIGPKLFSSKMVTPMMWDRGLSVGTACALCGWSIFLEDTARRQEMTLFVAPKALGTLFPRAYDKKYLWRERLVFVLSTATILTTAQQHPRKVKGVFGRLLGQVIS